MKTRTFILLLAAGIVLYGCAAQRKLTLIRSEAITPTLSLPGEKSITEVDTVRRNRKDTLRFTDFEGREVIIMNAIKDDNGDMVAYDVIDAAVVTARFRNVAERHGKVDLEFQVKIPAAMQDSKWQLRFHPDMYILEDSVRLDDIIITGTDYRKTQLRGYQQYQRFINTIITDTTKFINHWQLELFLERNIPQLYAMKTDSSYVSDEQFKSVYGVSQKEAVHHYTNLFAKRINERRKARMDDMFRRYVKSPIVTEGIRLDTVIVDSQGDFIYNYVQTISTRPRLKKVDIILSGDIYEQDNHLYTIPRSEPLTFYISSLSTLVDPTERYMTKVIERRVEANTACYIDFAQGKAEIDESLGYNAEEIGRIKGNLRDLLKNEKFDLDSITIAAFASPEGSVRHNEALSLRRAKSASSYFDSFVKEIRDSLRAEAGILISIEENGRETVSLHKEGPADIRFISHSGGENWRMLERLVESDDNLSDEWKEYFSELCSRESDLDAREREISRGANYRYLRETVYPKLRVVKFDLYLHRKGMVKDTVHTTVLDSVYMAGVQAIRERDYETAVTILRPYNDYNTAVAFCSLDYNASAMAILENLEKTAQVNYMLAVLYSRRGEDELAVKHYVHSCQQDPAYVHRGNLDPEISALIKRYNLNRQDEDEQETIY